MVLHFKLCAATSIPVLHI